MSKTDRSVVHNEPYRISAVSIRERHKELKNKGYSNPDIVKSAITLIQNDCNDKM